MMVGEIGSGSERPCDIAASIDFRMTAFLGEANETLSCDMGTNHLPYRCLNLARIV